MNDQWKEYVDGMRTGLSPYSTRSVDRLLKLVDAQDAVVEALETVDLLAVAQKMRERGHLIVADILEGADAVRRALAELKLE